MNFDEVLDANGKDWNRIVVQVEWKNMAKYGEGHDFEVWVCWNDVIGDGYICRVKKRKICEKCGQEIKE